MRTEESQSQTENSTTTLFKNFWKFLLLVLVVFFFTFLFFNIIGFVPEYTPQSVQELTTETLEYQKEVLESDADIEKTDTVLSSAPQEPLHITIPDVNIDVNIENPESRDIGILDVALNKGAVHYPGTGLLTEDANVFLFGHSSFLPNVINKNYQAFNGLRNIKGGEEIFVDSVDTRYVYRVETVELSHASDITIDLRRGERKLTLSTCNSFGAKTERYIVQADFVRIEAL